MKMFKIFKTFLNNLLGKIIEDQRYIKVDRKELLVYALMAPVIVVGIYVDNLMGW